MKTKYGELPNELLLAYVDSMVGKVYKMLPMKEEKSPTLHQYIESTLREFTGGKELVLELKNNQDFASILFIIENLLTEDNMNAYRTDVLKATGLVKRIRKRLSGVGK